MGSFSGNFRPVQESESKVQFLSGSPPPGKEPTGMHSLRTAVRGISIAPRTNSTLLVELVEQLSPLRLPSVLFELASTDAWLQSIMKQAEDCKCVTKLHTAYSFM